MLPREETVFHYQVAADIGRFVSVAVPSEVAPHTVLVVGHVEMASLDVQADREIGLVEGAVQIEVAIVYDNCAVGCIEGEDERV